MVILDFSEIWQPPLSVRERVKLEEELGPFLPGELYLIRSMGPQVVTVSERHADRVVWRGGPWGEASPDDFAERLVCSMRPAKSS